MILWFIVCIVAIVLITCLDSYLFKLRLLKAANSFQYRDHVNVIDGFYKGCVGRVNSECKSRYYEHRYEIGILNAGVVEKLVWIPAKYLEKGTW